MLSKAKIRARALTGAGALAVACGLWGIAAGPAHASSLNCSHGLNTSTKAWGTCTGSGTWRLTADCYAWSANSTAWAYQSGGTQSRYVTCPSWSHVTGVYVQTQQ